MGPPEFLPELSSVVEIASGFDHACARMASGSLACWGWGSSGQLGDESLEDFYSGPVTVLNISDAVGVSAGYAHSCALMEGGSVKCWGSNSEDALGRGADVDPEFSGEDAGDPSPGTVSGF